MSAATHGFGVPDANSSTSTNTKAGKPEAAPSELAAVRAAPSDASAGDDWGSAVAVAVLVVGLIVLALVCTGGG